MASPLRWSPDVVSRETTGLLSAERRGEGAAVPRAILVSVTTRQHERRHSCLMFQPSFPEALRSTVSRDPSAITSTWASARYGCRAPIPAGLTASWRLVSRPPRLGRALRIRRRTRPIILTVSQIFNLFRAAQHGQRDSIEARAATNLRRIVAIEFGTWRSGRNGRSSGLVTFAYGKLREHPGGTIR